MSVSDRILCSLISILFFIFIPEKIAAIVAAVLFVTIYYSSMDKFLIFDKNKNTCCLKTKSFTSEKVVWIIPFDSIISAKMVSSKDEMEQSVSSRNEAASFSLILNTKNGEKIPFGCSSFDELLFSEYSAKINGFIKSNMKKLELIQKPLVTKVIIIIVLIALILYSIYFIGKSF